MKTKVLFIIESFALGGAERALVDIANNLDRDSFEVTVCSFFKSSIYSDYQVEVTKHFKPHIHYRFLVNNRVKPVYYLFNYLLNRVPALLYNVIIGDRYDVVIAFNEGAPTHLIARASLKMGHKIAWLHTSTSLSQKGKSESNIRVVTEDYSRFEKIVAVSQGVADSFLGMFPSLAERVIVAYNPIDIDAIKEKSLSPISMAKSNCPLFVSVGRLVPVKGYDRYLRVIKKLNSRGYNFEVWIIGGGDIAFYESYCRKNNLHNVLFLGNQDNPYPFMRVADWIVVPSYVEGFGLVVLEGLVLQKAVLMTKCSSTPELLGNNEFGLIANNSEDSLYDSLKFILDDPSIRVQYEDKAEERSKQFGLHPSMNLINRIINVI